MNLLELPKDVLLGIWSFVTKVEDIFRFGATCKQIDSLAFQVARNIYINRKHHSFGVISNILGRDLGHLKKLELVSKYNSPVHLEEARHLVMEKISILTTLNKLKSLTIDFALEVDLLEDLAQILKKMPWLEELTAKFPRKDFGDLFINHNKLTKLTIKGLYFLIDDWRDHDGSATDTSPLNILPNLEIMDINHIYPTGFDNNFLKSLPKLQQLKVDLCDWDPDDIGLHMATINELTTLTCLQVVGKSMDHAVSTEQLSNLTNLRELFLAGQLQSPIDFTNFQYLTKLEFCSFDDDCDSDQIRFPPTLQNLGVLETSVHYSVPLMNKLFALDSLKTLTVNFGLWKSTNWPEEVFDISRLTNLKVLTFCENLPQGMGTSLLHLPNLQKIYLQTLSEQDMTELKDLTHLVQLIRPDSKHP
jgi:hypothetical protein